MDFACEISVIAARGLDGATADYGAIENIHHNHILDISIAPARVTAEIAAAAQSLARTVLTSLGVIGVIGVEFFVTHSGTLLINEIAPRPHNSGHFTIDACATSQFEQQVRTVCALPLGSTHQSRPAVMANLLGDLWQNGTPDWRAALADAAVKLHLYGKGEARPGRKMGHLTVCAETVDAALESALSARERLRQE